MKSKILSLTVVLAAMLSMVADVRAADAKSVKVFILAGQSNMEARPRSNSSNTSLINPLRMIFSSICKWVERDDVWIKFLDRKGKLTVGS